MWLIGQRNIFRPRCFERAHDRTNRSLRLSANQEAELWQRCTAGEALSDIARTLGKHAASVVAVVAEVWHFQPQIVMLHQLRQGGSNGCCCKMPQLLCCAAVSRLSAL